jgi:endonuclease-3
MSKRTEIVQKILNRLFPKPQVPLKHRDTYTLLIAVLLSAQTTDKQVNKITPLLFKKASTPEEMAKLPLKTIEKIVRPCGLGPTKARAIKKLSKILVEKYRGKVPKMRKNLEALPGVGHKTASVILVQAFHKPAFPVDTHIHRCAKRWGLSDGKSVTKTERDLKRIFPKEQWGILHLQMIYYARKYCPAKGHDISSCPICKQIAPIAPSVKKGNVYPKHFKS